MEAQRNVEIEILAKLSECLARNPWYHLVCRLKSGKFDAENILSPIQLMTTEKLDSWDTLAEKLQSIHGMFQRHGKADGTPHMRNSHI
ncbi:MAG: hypothetical protein ACYTFK_12950 [Planctomycetota bacterium]|jgi:hypothetical protein